MANFLVVIFSLLLLGGFLLMTTLEAGREKKFFSLKRASFDETTSRVLFVLTHVDLPKFFQSEIQEFLQMLVHKIAHFSLQIVRMVERMLTRLVRYFHNQNQMKAIPPRQTTREFVRTLSDFKDNLKTTHPKIDVFDVQ